MRVKDYEYNYAEEEYQITEERKEEILEKLKDCINKNNIAHFKILQIGKNDNEYDYIYETLLEQGVNIRGINGTISGERENFTHISKMTQSYTPPILDDDVQQELFWKLRELNQKIDAGDTSLISQRDEVRDNLILSNMRFAKWIANSPYINRFNIPVEDKEQMAMIGLINAVDNFDPTLNFKFSTYAYKPIQHSIIRENILRFQERRKSDKNIKPYYQAKNRKVKKERSRYITAQKMTDLLNYMYKKDSVVEQFLIQLNREPSQEEIVEILGINPKDIEDYEILQNFLSPEIITPQGKNFSTLADKDEIEAECGGTDLVHLGLDGDTETQAMVDECRKTIFEVLNTLTSRENEVIGLRFGLYCTKPKTLEEISEKFDVGRERIRQIEAKALRKLRSPLRGQKLRMYLDMYNEKEI